MKNASLLIAVSLTMGLAACSPSTNETETSATPAAPAASMGEMKMDAPPPVTAEKITGEGKVVAIDAAAGTIKLDHGPIPALNWGAMSMSFTASDPKMLEGLVVGDTVKF